MAPWTQKPNYETYKSPYGPKYVATIVPNELFLAPPLIAAYSYKTVPNFHGVSVGRAMKLYVQTPFDDEPTHSQALPELQSCTILLDI